MSRNTDKNRDTRIDDPSMHANYSRKTANSTGYFGWEIPGLMVRYIPRAIITAYPNILRDCKSAGVELPIPNEAKSILSNIEELARSAAHKLGISRAGDNEGQRGLFEECIESPEGKRIQDRLWRQGVSDSLEDALANRAYEIYKKQKRRDFGEITLHSQAWDGFAKKVESQTAVNKTMRWYDNIVGTGSLMITGYYASRVANDIKTVFAETIAYEMDKSPKDVTYRDIWRSKNRLVQEVRDNFINKNILRAGTDMLFFAGNLSHLPKLGWLNKYYFSDLGIGVKGVQLLSEVLYKKNTIFEDLTHLIDNKMNPLKGLGSPITVGDVFDLYQKYTEKHDPQATFRDALSGQNHDGRDWDKAQAIFKRVTELMNLTYKYKHIGRQPSETEQAQADFALPKFLYLLGNGLIDTYKPEETLAYIEVANAYGIPAVRQLQRILERGIPVDQALVNYPEELRRKVLQLREHPASEETPPPPFTAVPTTSIQRPVEAAAIHTAPSLQMSAL